MRESDFSPELLVRIEQSRVIGQLPSPFSPLPPVQILNTLRAINGLKPQNLYFFPRTHHRRPFLYLAPCGGEWQKTLDCRAFCHCGPLRVLARCGYFLRIITVHRARKNLRGL
jgi:hypothetical protein